jgi:nickel/cobalt exporter
MRIRRLLAGCAVAATLLAHPMGNYSVSHYTRIEVSPAGASMLYVLDLAEIPTFELFRQWSVDRSTPRDILDQKAAAQAREWLKGLRIRANGKTITPAFVNAQFSMADGAGGVPVVRIAARTTLAIAPGTLEFEDSNFAERAAGWKEVVVRAAPGASITSSNGAGEERSEALTAYPQDPNVAIPQELKASIEWTAGAAVSKAVPPVETKSAPAPPPITRSTPPQTPSPGEVTRGDFLSRLVSGQELGFGAMLLGLGAAFVFGGMHALSPGHGKTLVAAYLVGAKGTWKHAVFLGAMTTFTHTISVFALGIVTLFLSTYIAPETLNPILGAISGVSIVWIGGMLLVKRIRKLHHHHHHHSHDHGHHHHHHHDHDHGHHHHHHHDHDHTHSHDHGSGHHHHHVPEGDITLGSLIALGASGGLVPCPSALVLLLSAISFNRTVLGMVLLVAFSLGLAAVLTGIGLLVLYAKNLLPESKRTSDNPWFRYLPVASAAIIVVVGLGMTAVALGVIKPGGLIG